MDLPEADRPADARKWFRAFFVGFVRGRGKDRKPENKKYAAFKFQNFSMSSKKEKLLAFSAGKRNGRKALESALSDAFHFFALADIAFETGKERCYADSSIRDAIFFTGGITCSVLEIIALTEIVPIFGSFSALTLVVAAAAAEKNIPSVK